MSKQKNGKDPIETFFQKKARDYDVPYNPAHWEKLEGELDRLNKNYHNRMWRRGVAAAAVILFSLLGYFTYQNYSQLNQITELLNTRNTDIRQPTDKPADGLTNSEGTSPGSQDQLSGDNNEERATTANEGKSSSKNRDSNGNPSPSDLESTGVPEAVTTENIVRGEKTTGSSPNERKDLFITEVNCPECGLSQSPIFQNMSAFEYASYNRSEEQSNEPFITSYTQSEISSDLSENSNRASQGSRISLGLVLGPDLSTTGFFSSFYDPGYTIGVHAEYHISPRLSLRTGIQQSKVRYSAGSDNYKPPYGYWTNGIAADETLADCMVLDIPISLKYSFLQTGQSRFYASAGLTSYIMLQEKYRFFYDDQQAGRVQSWDGRTGTRHWMSNAAFSVGYEWDILKNWSLRAEPYVKLPLKEIGWGNVNLYSTGSFLSLNYRFQ